MARAKREPLRDVLRRTYNKLDQAHFLLNHLSSAVRQDPTVLLAVESFLGGCLGATQAAFYILDNEAPNAKMVYKAWRSSLIPSERTFLDRMMKERGDDVHGGRTTLHLNLTIQPGGTPPTSTEFRFRSHSDKAEIVDACRRFIVMIDALARTFGPRGSAASPGNQSAEGA